MSVVVFALFSAMILRLDAFQKLAELLVGLSPGCCGILGTRLVCVRKSAEVALID